MEHFIGLSAIGEQVTRQVQFIPASFADVFFLMELQLFPIYRKEVGCGRDMPAVCRAAQQQEGGYDCRLFAVAVATELCFGGDPIKETFNHQQAPPAPFLSEGREFALSSTESE